jgi:hypothetical protein
MRTWSRVALPAAVLAAAVALTACGSVSGRERAAAAAAERFVTAVADGDGAAACAALAPKTVEELETSGGACAEAILDEDLPEPGRVDTTDVYGQWARVVMPDNTLFLAMFPDGWRVAAAGCHPAGEGPYDCVLQGG